MSVALKFSIVGGPLPQLDELLTRAGNLQGFNEVAGRASTNLVKSHFVEKDHEGNASGGTSTHYYGQAAAATQFVADSAGFTISVNQIGMNLLYHGGTVHPKVKKLLAIPAIPETHGRHPSEFQNLTLRWGRGKEGTIRPVALVEKELGAGTTQTAKGRFQAIPVRLGTYKAGRRKGAEIHPRWKGGKDKDAKETDPRVFYWLSLEARIGAHPDTLPPQEELMAVATDAGYRYLLRRQRQSE